MKGCNPPAYEYASEMMCEAIFMNPTSKSKYLYTLILEGDTILRMNQVLMANIQLVYILKSITNYVRGV